MQTYSYPKTNHLRKERASSFTSKGSITLEAAMVLPIFFLAMLCMMYLFEIASVQVVIKNALVTVGKELAEEAYVAPILSTNQMEDRIVDCIGAERLNRSIVAQGEAGIDCSNSRVNLRTTVLNLNVRYQLEIPVLIFRIPIRTCEERLKMKGWTGYTDGENSSEEDEFVYVTDYGIVYHNSLACGYLELSIRGVLENQVDEERNKSGEIYYPCETCGDLEAGSVVYITDYGNRYHTSLDCSGLKRSIYMVPLSEVNGLGGCSKCVY